MSFTPPSLLVGLAPAAAAVAEPAVRPFVAGFLVDTPFLLELVPVILGSTLVGLVLLRRRLRDRG